MWLELNGYLHKEKGILRNVFPISFSFFFLSLAWAMVLPIFAIRINEITNSVFITGIVFALWGIVRFLLDFPVGILYDEVSAKKLMVASSALYIFIAIGYSMVDTVFELVTLRVFHAFLGSFLWVGAWTIVRKFAKKKHVDENIGFFSGVYGLPILVGPILGSFLIKTFSWQWVFYAASISMFFMFLIILFKVPDKKITATKNPAALIKSELKAFKNLGKIAFTITTTLILLFVISSMFGSFLPILLEDKFDITQIGFILSASVLPTILLSVPAGKFADIYGEKNIVIIGMIIASLGFFMFSQSTDFLEVLTAVFVLNIGYAMVSPVINSVIVEWTTNKNLGGFTGLTEVFKDIGQVIGPILGGFILNRFDVTVMIYVSILLSMIIIVTFLKMYNVNALKQANK